MSSAQTYRPRPGEAAGTLSSRPRSRGKGGTRHAAVRPSGGAAYKDMDAFIVLVSHATPFELVELERRGVEGRFLKDLSARLDLPQLVVYDMLGVPKATAAKKVAAREVIAGTGGQAAIGVAKLIAKAQEIVANSTAEEARNFDAAKWLGKWLEVPQPALGGRKPSELLDTPTGLDVVLKLLGALESGAYQ